MSRAAGTSRCRSSATARATSLRLASATARRSGATKSHRRDARAQSSRPHPRGSMGHGVRPRSLGGFRERGHRRISLRRHDRRILLPRGQQPAPGRAWRDGGRLSASTWSNGWCGRQGGGWPPLDQASVAPRGASIQARLYAEDPGATSPERRSSDACDVAEGRPRRGRGAERVRGVAVYDPMLAKIIVSGATRDEALAKLQAALDRTEIGGLETNLDYLRQLSRSDVLARGEMLTRTLQSFDYSARTIEVLAPGTQTTIRMAGPRRILGGRRAALRADGCAVVPPCQPARRQRGGRRRD